MKILLISVHGDPLERLGSVQAGGQNNYVKQVAQALENQGHQVDVATHWNNKRSKGSQTFGKNITVMRIAAGQRKFVRKDELVHLLPAFFEELEQRTDLASYDVIHTNYWLSGLVGLMIKGKYNRPLVHTSHSLGHVKAKETGSVAEGRLEAEKRILTEADRVIATTNDEKKKIDKWTDRKSSVRVVSIGVHEVFFNEEPRELPSQPRFMFVGRMTKAKGIFVLLSAFADYLAQVNPDASLVIAGGGKDDFIEGRNFEPKREEIRALISGIESRVNFVGPKSQAELAMMFKTCTAVIVPSFYESFGMVASEAQAAGVPVIASAVGGLKDVVVHGETGLLFRNKRVVELRACMRRVSEDPALNLHMGEQARRHAEQTFNWQSISALMEKIYADIQG